MELGIVEKTAPFFSRAPEKSPTIVTAFQTILLGSGTGLYCQTRLQ